MAGRAKENPAGREVPTEDSAARRQPAAGLSSSPPPLHPAVAAVHPQAGERVLDQQPLDPLGRGSSEPTPRTPRGPGAGPSSSVVLRGVVMREALLLVELPARTEERTRTCRDPWAARPTAAARRRTARAESDRAPGRAQAAAPWAWFWGSGLSVRLALGLAARLSLLRPLAVTSHLIKHQAFILCGVCLPHQRQMLAQLDAVRVVPLRLLSLVVAPLALLALQGDGDSYVSASHGSCESLRGVGRPGKGKPRRPRGCAGGSAVSRVTEPDADRDPDAACFMAGIWPSPSRPGAPRSCSCTASATIAELGPRRCSA